MKLVTSSLQSLFLHGITKPMPHRGGHQHEHHPNSDVHHQHHVATATGAPGAALRPGASPRISW